MSAFIIGKVFNSQSLFCIVITTESFADLLRDTQRSSSLLSTIKLLKVLSEKEKIFHKDALSLFLWIS